MEQFELGMEQDREKNPAIFQYAKFFDTHEIGCDKSKKTNYFLNIIKK